MDLSGNDREGLSVSQLAFLRTTKEPEVCQSCSHDVRATALSDPEWEERNQSIIHRPAVDDPDSDSDPDDDARRTRVTL